MRLRLSLAHKVLILVSIPFFILVGFVGFLSHLQHESEVEAQRAREERDISDRMNKLSSEYFVVVRDLGSIGMSRWLANENIVNIYKGLIPKTRERYAELLRLSQGKPDLAIAVRNSTRTLDEIDMMLGDALKALSEHRLSDLIKDYAAKTDRLTYLCKKLATEQQDLIALHQRLAEDENSQRQGALRQKYLESALAVVAVSGVFNLLLAVFIIKNITSRLLVVNENVQKFSSNQPLHKTLSGNDEIAELDRVFHRMAASLEDAARQKQDMINMLTHDLRSPLTAISGTLDIIRGGESNFSERDKQLFKLAERNGKRMMALINDLLDIERINSGMMTAETTDVCLAIVFEDVKLSVADWVADRGIKLVIDDTALFVKADREKLDRVMYNLVSNALKFSPEGGTISLKAAPSNGEVEIIVMDQGRGIAPQELESIFERFSQSASKEQKAQGGSGLGLFICKSIVTLMGGKIWATNEAGQGAVIHFTLPKC
ncbi:MAG TPA: HAMP domain-containing sensor histidine kinase [Planktothrix sp.]